MELSFTYFRNGDDVNTADRTMYCHCFSRAFAFLSSRFFFIPSSSFMKGEQLTLVSNNDCLTPKQTKKSTFWWREENDSIRPVILIIEKSVSNGNVRESFSSWHTRRLCRLLHPHLLLSFVLN